MTSVRKNQVILRRRLIDYGKKEDEMIEVEGEMIQAEDEEYAGIDYATKCYSLVDVSQLN